MIVDFNVHWGHWPTGRWPWKTLRSLVRELEILKISKALISSLESVLYPDPVETDSLLLRKIKPFPLFLPVGTINPVISSWTKQLTEKRFVAFKLLPGYWSCSLKEKTVKKLFSALQQADRPVLLQMRLEDERSQIYPLQVEAPSVENIISLAKTFPDISLVVLNAYFGEATRLARQPNIYVDLSFVEKFETLNSFLKEVPAGKIVFGSHTPFLYPAAALAKVKAGKPSVRKVIFSGNARRILPLD